jgi:hypothetical protein
MRYTERDSNYGTFTPQLVLFTTIRRVRNFQFLGHFLATFSVLSSGSELQRVYGAWSQPIVNREETQLTATLRNW